MVEQAGDNTDMVDATESTDMVTAVPSAVVSEGKWILLATSDEKYLFVQAISDRTVRIGRHLVRLAPLVGAPFGAVFEVGQQNH